MDPSNSRPVTDAAERWRAVAVAHAQRVRFSRPWSDFGRELWMRAARSMTTRQGPQRDDATGAGTPPRHLALPKTAPEAESPIASPAPATPPTLPAVVPAPRVLDNRVHAMLEQMLQTRLPAIRVHTDLAADILARHHGADALVRNGEMHFRQGTYDPDTSRGRGLLAHEALHVAWAQGFRPSPPPVTAYDPAAWEEQIALQVEARARRNDVAASVPASRTTPVTRMPPAESSPGGSRTVRTAATDRDVPAPEPAPRAGGGSLSEAQVRALKDELYRTLLDRLRSEFERGG